MSAISYEVLDKLTGELLPERTVLGAVSTAFSNGLGGGSWGGFDEGTTVVSACQATNAPATPGLMGGFGWGAISPSSSITSFTCIPAVVVSH
jgi:hypothetical protein